VSTDAQSGSGRIVVGVDGSPHSEEALRWALRHARLTGQSIEAVTSWEVPVNFSVGPLTDFDWEGQATTALKDTVAKVVDPAEPTAAWAADKVPMEEYPAGSDGP
jgi:nucleotide-binding universal stress UspA family protein